ncbi:MAG: hypothetical protein ABL997_16290 [Planctomycetota bacterium]
MSRQHALFTLALLGLIATGFCEPVVAQAYARKYGSFMKPTQSFGFRGLLEMADDEVGVRWEMATPTGYVLLATAALPFDIPGSAQELDTSGKVLVCGRDHATGTGHVHILQLVPGSSPAIQTLKSATYPGLDVGAALFKDGHLFVHDVEGRRILVAAYAAGSALPPLSSYAIAVDTAWFVTHGPQRLHEVFPTPPDLFSGVGVCFQALAGPSWNLYQSATGWSVREAYADEAIGHRPRWSIVNEYHHKAEEPLSVGGIANKAFEVVDVDSGAIVAAGTNPATDYVSLSFATVPGRRYQVRGTDATTSPLVFIANKRYGEPSAPASGIQMSRCTPQDNLFINNPVFSLRGKLSYASPDLAKEDSVPVYLWLGMRQPDGTDPIAWYGDQAVLSDLIGSAGPTSVSMKVDGAKFSFAVPIPNDPQLVGHLFFWQYAAVVGNQFIVSDVCGAIARPFPVPGASAVVSGSENRGAPNNGLHQRSPEALRVWRRMRE